MKVKEMEEKIAQLEKKRDKVWIEESTMSNNNNKKKKKKICNAQIVMNHELEVWAVARWPDGVC